MYSLDICKSQTQLFRSILTPVRNALVLARKYPDLVTVEQLTALEDMNSELADGMYTWMERLDQHMEDGSF